MFSTKLMHYEDMTSFHRHHFVFFFYHLREIFTERRFQRDKLWTNKISISVYFFKNSALFCHSGGISTDKRFQRDNYVNTNIISALVIPVESKIKDASSVTKCVV